jgi:uncharacterized protein (DUF2236 family)
MIWQVDREIALLLGGGRALLMQLAHPAVASGVADHSHFREDPIGRLSRTMDTMWSVVFGDSQQSGAALRRVDKIHQGVHGRVKDGGRAKTYDARDLRLLLWVHATLVDSTLVTHDLFVRQLSADEKNQYYEDTKIFGQLFGIPAEMMPRSLADFNAYLEGMIGGGEISVGETARDLARDILWPRPWVLRPGGPLQALVTTGLLAPPLREAYGLEWTERKEKRFLLVASVIRRLLPFLPRIVRIVPHARRAEKGP